jgi:uncharacterized repeat protein (TIGR03806 family)
MGPTRRRCAVVLLILLTGCGNPERVRFFAADAYPQRLSEWGVIRLDGDMLRLGPGVEPYDLNAPLFTDYAQKLRTLYLPPDSAAGYRDDAPLDFPVGTIISKTFFYPRGERPGLVRASYEWEPGQRALDRGAVAVLETRLLIRQADGWDALPYVWRGDDALLTLAGAVIPLEIARHDDIESLPYIVPTRNECASCHATDHTRRAIQPIGPSARQLNRGYLGGAGNQLTDLEAACRLTGLPDLAGVPRNADPHGSGPLDDRARAYLDANCGHCHSPTGAADTSALLLHAGATSSRELGICKPPIAAGQGTGGRAYSIVPGAPDESILVYRVATTDPASRMPELGRSLAHREGIELLSQWIAAMPGRCVRGLPAHSRSSTSG